MSALLDELIKLAANNKEPLPNVLRKCLILGHELKNERLKTWANQELNGYDSPELVPEYRVLRALAIGDFSGPFGSGARNMPIPAYLLREEHRHFAEKVYLSQPIGSLQDTVTSAKGHGLAFPWPGDFITMYQDRIQTQNGMVLVAAKQTLSTSAIVGLLDTVRNKTLNMALEIKAELGTSYKDLERAESPQAEEKIRNIIIQNTGGSTNVAFGHSSLDASGQVQNSITIGDRGSLDRALISAGLNKDDLERLTQAMTGDGGKLGNQVMRWAKDKGSKVLCAGMKVGQQIGTALLLKYLEAHYGIKT